MANKEEIKYCQQVGCTNVARWHNETRPGRKSLGHYGKRCNSCSNLLQKFGIDTPERDTMLAAQGGKCLICEIPVEFTGILNDPSPHYAHVDHCHTAQAEGTVWVRGILCVGCNLDLGKYETLLPKAKAFEKYLDNYGYKGD